MEYCFELMSIERKGETTHQKEEWKEVKYAYPDFMYIGESASIPMSDGRHLRTSQVVDFQLHGRHMVVETRNTKYVFSKVV